MFVAMDRSFVDAFRKDHGLAHEEGSLFTYLARVMKTARMLHEVTTLDEFASVEDLDRILATLAPGEGRVMDQKSAEKGAEG